MYTISGNSNILQALNIAGGIKENGSLRNISIIRDGKVIQNVDLYKALIFGDLNNIPTLQSGDKPAANLVRAGSGFVNEAIFELKENETFQDLYDFAGGILKSAKNQEYTVIRFIDSKFENFKLVKSDLSKTYVKDLDTINLKIEKTGTIKITGSVQNPGSYTISSNDRISDVVKREGTDSAFVFGAALYRESAKKLERNTLTEHIKTS